MAIRENLELIRNNIENACRRVKRDPQQVQLLAVCKDQGPEKIRQVLDLGIRLLGENKTQEAEAHMRHFTGIRVDWHFIGKLQKNKINKILSMFHFIESVDGVKSLEHIHKRVDDPVEVFIEAFRQIQSRALAEISDRIVQNITDDVFDVQRQAP